jgi:hypothetical protein
MRGSAVQRMGYMIWLEYVRNQLDPPHVAIRSHEHLFEEGRVERMYTYFAPGWQAKTEFAFRKGAGYGTEPIGALVSECEDGEVFPSQFLYEAKKESPWKSQRTS